MSIFRLIQVQAGHERSCNGRKMSSGKRESGPRSADMDPLGRCGTVPSLVARR